MAELTVTVKLKRTAFAKAVTWLYIQALKSLVRLGIMEEDEAVERVFNYAKSGFWYKVGNKNRWCKLYN